MPHVQGQARDAVMLFRPSLDEYITPDNPVRFIDAFVDQFDLQALGFARVIPAETGCPAYHPGDLLNASLSHVRIETAVYAQSGWPRITRAAYEDASDRMARRVRDHPEIMQLRHQLVEHPFGTFKRVMNQGYFVCRGLKKVNAEMSLSVMTYNLKRAINILGVPKLTVALRE